MSVIIKRVWNQNKMVNIEALQGMAFQAEDGGHTFEISGIDDAGATVSLSGTVAGVFRRPDNADIALTGAASDGKVFVTLTEDCYAVPGRFGLTIFVTNDSKKTAVYAAIGTVSSTSGGAVAGETPKDVVDLINDIAAAVATIPASYTDLMATIAPTYSPDAVYPVGYYVWHDGTLHNSIVPITTAETWTAEHWTAAVVGNDLTNLKTALSYVNESLDSIEKIPVYGDWQQGSISSSGAETDSTTRIRTPFISVDNFDQMSVYVDSGYLYEVYRYDSNKDIIEIISWNNTPRFVNLTNVAYVRFLLCKSGNTNIVPSDGVHLQIWGYTAAYTWKQIVETDYLHDGGYVTGSTMSTVLSDANNAVANKCYTIRFTNDEENILPNLPFSRTKLNETDLLLLVTFPASSYKLQLLFARNGDMWARMGVVSNNHWFPWYKDGVNSDSGETIHVGTGQEYTKLTDAIKYSFEHANTTVIVHPGTYDIVSEMGSSYWQNFSGYSDLTHAKIGNGAHFIFSPDALVTCQYTGSNTAVNTLYSPFNSLDGYEGDFTIEGMTLVVSGCRYAIHDDVGASTVEQTHRYINCDISNDKRCIGAGLGANMTVEMRDCVFRSTGASGNSPVSWHNSGGGTTGKGSIVMTGCYVTGAGNNTVQFLYHGISTKKTRVLVSNNSLGAQIITGPAEQSDTENNFEVIAWNNEIRQ